MHLIGQRVRDTVDEGDIGVVPVSLRGQKTSRQHKKKRGIDGRGMVEEK